MGKVYAEITAELAAWVGGQPVFFVASAPLSAGGHVNVSPKGLDCLRILGPHRVAYLDLTGSGAETVAHVRENGRIVLMFCAFTGPPKIVRFHGSAAVVLPGSSRWKQLRGAFPEYLGARAIIDVEVTRVSDSCGYGVPQFSGPVQREALQGWARTKDASQGLVPYRKEKNAHSIDGLPACEPGE
jgi:hypothetical protein